ncbi:MAG: hypothetical protein ACLPVW_18000 [Terriglobales bacterium]
MKEVSSSVLILGGAAVYRCGKRFVLISALAAGGKVLDWKRFFCQPV